MRPITTRQAETMADIRSIFALRYDYYILGHELPVDADPDLREVMLQRDCLALQFGTYHGDDLIGCFRIEFGASDALAFAADWSFADFVDEPLDMTAIVSGFCVSPHLRDDRIIAHMVRESAGIVRDFRLSHSFFETSPELWPQFHVEGLSRKGGALVDRETGLPTAVYLLKTPARPQSASLAGPAIDDDSQALIETTSPSMRPRLKLVGGRGR